MTQRTSIFVLTQFHITAQLSDPVFDETFERFAQFEATTNDIYMAQEEYCRAMRQLHSSSQRVSAAIMAYHIAEQQFRTSSATGLGETAHISAGYERLRDPNDRLNRINSHLENFCHAPVQRFLEREVVGQVSSTLHCKLLHFT